MCFTQHAVHCHASHQPHSYCNLHVMLAMRAGPHVAFHHHIATASLEQFMYVFFRQHFYVSTPAAMTFTEVQMHCFAQNMPAPLHASTPASQYPCITVPLHHSTPPSQYPCMPVPLHASTPSFQYLPSQYPSMPVPLYDSTPASQYPSITVPLHHSTPAHRSFSRAAAPSKLCPKAVSYSRDSSKLLPYPCHACLPTLKVRAAGFCSFPAHVSCGLNIICTVHHLAV